jgi:hypothetical protein
MTGIATTATPVLHPRGHVVVRPSRQASYRAVTLPGDPAGRVVPWKRHGFKSFAAGRKADVQLSTQEAEKRVGGSRRAQEPGSKAEGSVNSEWTVYKAATRALTTRNALGVGLPSCLVLPANAPMDGALLCLRCMDSAGGTVGGSIGTEEGGDRGSRSKLQRRR